MPEHASPSARRAGALVCLACLAALASCDRARRASSENEAANVVVLSAPVAGTVRRVLAREGVNVSENAPVIEIEPDAAAPRSGDAADPELEARARAAAAREHARDLQAEVERAAIEVQRVEALVRQNAAPPAQLDAARAVYQRAQEQQQRAAIAEPNPPAVASRTLATAAAAETPAQIVAVRATAAGSLRVVSVRQGQRVAAGQPVATLAPAGR